MRFRLKGINCVRKRLASGRDVTYWYAWKSGPALRGEPGSPEFISSYNEAIEPLRSQASPRHTTCDRHTRCNSPKVGIGPRSMMPGY